MSYDRDPTLKINSKRKNWQMIPFTTSKWWTGIVSYKLVAIKPSRVTGKLLIRYRFHGLDSSIIDTQDSMRRDVVKEWDLGQSNICEFDVSAVTTLGARYTWIPNVQPLKIDNVYSNTTLAAQIPTYSAYGLGDIEIEAAQRLQVGSIFPDDCRIMIFRTFKNAKFLTPTAWLIDCSNPNFSYGVWHFLRRR